MHIFKSTLCCRDVDTSLAQETHQEMRHPNVTGTEIWGGALYPLRPRTRQDFICCCWRCFYNLCPECGLSCLKDLRVKQGVLKLMLGHCAPRSLYHLPGYVISTAVDLVLVFINLQPEYDFPSFTRFKQFQKFGKNCVGALSSPATYP